MASGLCDSSKGQRRKGVFYIVSTDDECVLWLLKSYSFLVHYILTWDFFFFFPYIPIDVFSYFASMSPYYHILARCYPSLRLPWCCNTVRPL